jgi:nitrite reductase/ring-hydroxylating ferredoxin subunit
MPELPDGPPIGRTALRCARHTRATGAPPRTHAIHDRCGHRGCLLSNGELDGDVITCSCHGSRFDVRDGALLQGPAVAAQPAFECREVDGRIEVRRISRG